MLDDPTDRQAVEKALARTYDHQAYTDEWDAVEQYREVMAYKAQHPNHGRVRVGNALELPPSRVRTWLDGGMPDPARGVITAAEKGWLPSDGELPPAIQEAAAWLLSSGSIAEEYFVPYFVIPADVQRSSIRQLGSDLTVRLRIEERDTRSVEATPKEHASALGRLLHVYGVPVGERITTLRTVPTVLTAPPTAGQERAAATYLSLRGQLLDFADRYAIYHEDAPAAYIESLGTWFESLTDGDVTTTDTAVQIPKSAATQLTEGRTAVQR